MQGRLGIFWAIFWFIITSGGIYFVYLFFVDVSIQEEPLIAVVGLFTALFGLAFFAQNINYLKKFRYVRTYRLDTTGITIAHGTSREHYLWSEVKKWEDTEHMTKDTPTYYWFDIILKNNKRVMVELPEDLLEHVKTLLNRHGRQIMEG